MSLDTNRLEAAYRREGLVLLDRAENSILELERDAGAGPDTIGDLFRAVHTIKGNSALFDLPLIQRLAHPFEDFLGYLRDGTMSATPGSIDVMLEAVDLLRRLLLHETVEEDTIERQTARIIKLAMGQDTADETNTDVALAMHPILEPTPRQMKAKSRVTLPAGSRAKAREQGLFLAVILLDAARQRFRTIRDFVLFLKTLPEDVELMGCGPLETDFAPDAPALPYFLCIASREHPERLSVVRDLHRPRMRLIEIGRERVEDAPRPTLEPTNIEPEAESAYDKTLNVSLGLVNEMIALAAETTIARNELLQKFEREQDIHGVLPTARKVSRLITNLQQVIMRSRLQKVEEVFQRCPRIVRDACRVSGKEVHLETIGGETELDKTLIDVLLDPLTHILRNAVAHGIEAPHSRRERGKPVAGRIQIRATLGGGNVIVRVRDDGGGLDLERIRARALERGLIEEHETHDEERVVDLIFRPGFSTRDEVDANSGRGVGMDVVRTRLEDAGGSVHVENRPGAGCVFTLSLPQTLAIITCLLVRVGSARLGVPEKNMEEMMALDRERVSIVSGHEVYELRGRMIPLVRLPGTTESSRRYVLVVRTDRSRFGLVLDDIINPEEFVVRPLSRYLKASPFYSGAGVMGDGEAILILDINGLARFAGIKANLMETAERDRQDMHRGTAGYLIVAIGADRFAVSLLDFPRLQRLNPGDLMPSFGREVLRGTERLIPIVRVRTDSTAGAARVLVFRRGERQVAVPVSDVSSISEFTPRWDRTAGESFVSHTALFEGRPIGLLNVDALFAAGMDAPAGRVPA